MRNQILKFSSINILKDPLSGKIQLICFSHGPFFLTALRCPPCPHIKISHGCLMHVACALLLSRWRHSQTLVPFCGDSYTAGLFHKFVLKRGIKVGQTWIFNANADFLFKITVQRRGNSTYNSSKVLQMFTWQIERECTVHWIKLYNIFYWVTYINNNALLYNANRLQTWTNVISHKTEPLVVCQTLWLPFSASWSSRKQPWGA